VSSHACGLVGLTRNSFALEPRLEARCNDVPRVVSARPTRSPRRVWTKKGGSKLRLANTVQRQRWQKNKRIRGISLIQTFRCMRVSCGASQGHLNIFMGSAKVQSFCMLLVAVLGQFLWSGVYANSIPPLSGLLNRLLLPAFSTMLKCGSAPKGLRKWRRCGATFTMRQDADTCFDHPIAELAHRDI
jgi:hypothetical protein